MGGRPFLEMGRFDLRMSSASYFTGEFLSMAFLKSRGPRLVLAGLLLLGLLFNVFFRSLNRCLMFSFLKTVRKCLKSLVYCRFGVELYLNSLLPGWLRFITTDYDGFNCG